VLVRASSNQLEYAISTGADRSELAEGLPGADRDLHMQKCGADAALDVGRLKLPTETILSSISISRAIAFRTRSFEVVCFMSSMPVGLVSYRTVTVRPGSLFL